MSTATTRRPRDMRGLTSRGAGVLRSPAIACLVAALAGAALWQGCTRCFDGESASALGKPHPLLLPRWAGFGVSWSKDVSRTVPSDKLVVLTERGERVLSSSCSALAATTSGQRLAYTTVVHEGSYALSREEEQFAEQLRDMGYPGIDVRDSYNELVIVDVLTGLKKVAAVFTAHPSLHNAESKQLPVIRAGGIERLWWSGEHTVYAQAGSDMVYRLNTESGDWTMLRLSHAGHARIEDARSSPQGAPLALKVVDDIGTAACLVDPETLRIIWRGPSATSAPAYSPSGDAVAWVAATGDDRSRTVRIAVRDLGTGTVKHYTPDVELTRGTFYDIWWIRRPEFLVVCGRRSVTFGTFEIGVWRIGSDRVQRVGLGLDGVRPFTPL